MSLQEENARLRTALERILTLHGEYAIVDAHDVAEEALYPGRPTNAARTREREADQLVALARQLAPGQRLFASRASDAIDPGQMHGAFVEVVDPGLRPGLVKARIKYLLNSTPEQMGGIGEIRDFAIECLFVETDDGWKPIAARSSD